MNSEGRQDRPFSTNVAGIPLIIYPAKDSNPLSDAGWGGA